MYIHELLVLVLLLVSFSLYVFFLARLYGEALTDGGTAGYAIGGRTCLS